MREDQADDTSLMQSYTAEVARESHIAGAH